MNKENLIWIDLEMTGLDTVNDHIIEIATIVTDSELTVLAEGPMLAINQPKSVMEGMDEWNTLQHGKSGLTKRVLETDMTLAEAEAETLKFLSEWVPAKASPMCGNTICQDRRFLAREMTELEAFFHYRHIDVSTIKELSRRWYPDAEPYVKQGSHLAMDDIRDSIRELQHYRKQFFTPVEK